MILQVYPNTPCKAIQWFPGVSHMVEDAIERQIFLRGDVGRISKADEDDFVSFDIHSGDWLVWGEDKEGDQFMEIIPDHRFKEYYFQKTTE